ncbi:MAG: isoleucine--tRNA ligase [Bacilli bacterium]
MKKIFEELNKEKVSVVEKVISDKWEQDDMLNKTIENRSGSKNFVFYEGPPTANGMPGVHHVLARNLKDAICKYKTMQGYRVVRKAGWDTHGLPVEIEVEKELGLNDKNGIEEYGIEKFNEKCKESVFKYKNAWEKMTKQMGYFVDMKDPYVTYHNSYIETEWYILKKFFDEGLMYKGHKIVPYCTRCGTGLASHEVAQGYKEVEVNAVTVPFKLKDENTYLLVWTTTPWTLLANTAACVNPNEKYIKASSKGYNFILAKKLAEKVLGDKYEVLEEYNGKDLEFKEYEQLLPFLKVDKKGFFITCADYVTMDDGTGIVHIAPAFGEDDYNVGKKYNLPFLNPVGENGKYIEGPWQGMPVFETDIEIIKYLKKNDKLFKKEKLSHNYPHCWRCSTPLLYYAKPSWYIKMTELRDKLVKNNNEINWYPAFVGEKRFGNWLENVNDWALSRNRYWGTPLNIWKCECGHLESIGSIKELVKKAVEDIDETIELHRPYVDNIHIKCPKCGKLISRVKEVIDCWFDSGSMPFAQYHYPFENKELFENQFPADFISEAIDQTRGWFYSLLAISTFVMNTSSYKNVLVTDLLVDKNGQKMSKSKGNAIDPFEMFEEYGADTLRWYLLYVSPVWTPMKFDIEGLKEVRSKFFNTLRNTYTFFALYANTDEIEIETCNIKYNDLELTDKWLISKYNKLVKNVTESYDSYDLYKVVKAITEFVSEDLSNWYIRINRKRFWSSNFDNSKKGVYKTTYEVLVGIAQLIAPICPFISEEIYIKLTKKYSVHTSDFPKPNNELINEEVELKMDLVRDLVSIGRFVREDAKTKIRQPLSEILLDNKNKDIIGDLTNLILSELNIKKVHYVKDLTTYMNLSVRPNFKNVGKLFGSSIKEFQNKLSNLATTDVNKLQKNESIKMVINNQEYNIDETMVEIRITSKEGFNVGTDNKNFVILDTTLNADLIQEGIAREFISKVQQLRKNKDFNVIDRIIVYYSSNNNVKQAIEKHLTYIKKETLAENIIEKDGLNESYDLNGNVTKIDVEKL